MKLKININNKQYNIPLGWSDVSIGKFQQVTQIDPKAIPNEGDRKRLLLCAILGAELDEILSLPLDIVNDLESVLSWTSEYPSPPSVDTFTIDGIKYGLVDFQKMSLGEFIDLDKALEQGPVENIHVIASIIYRPVTDTKPSVLSRVMNRLNPKHSVSPHQVEPYDSRTMRTRAALFQEKLSINDIYNAIVFFSLFGLEFSKTLVASLQAEEMEKQERMKTSLN